MSFRKDTQIIRIEGRCGMMLYEGLPGLDLFSSHRQATAFLQKKYTLKSKVRVCALLGYIVSDRTAHLLVATKVRNEGDLLGLYTINVVVESTWIKIELSYLSSFTSSLNGSTKLPFGISQDIDQLNISGNSVNYSLSSSSSSTQTNASYSSSSNNNNNNSTLNSSNSGVNNNSNSTSSLPSITSQTPTSNIINNLLSYSIDGTHFYCESYDLTSYFPSNNTTPYQYCSEFCWNEWLRHPFENASLSHLAVVLLQGFTSTKHLPNLNISMSYLMKRSKLNPDTFSYASSMNERAGTANEYECELIMWKFNQNTSQQLSGSQNNINNSNNHSIQWTSHIWRRGSIPIQRLNSSKKENINEILKDNNLFEQSDQYYLNLLNRYQNFYDDNKMSLPNIHLVNLLRNDEGLEQTLSTLYNKSCEKVMSSINLNLNLINFDWFGILKNNNNSLSKTVQTLWSILKDTIENAGFSKGLAKFIYLEEFNNNQQQLIQQSPQQNQQLQQQQPYQPPSLSDSFDSSSSVPSSPSFMSVGGNGNGLVTFDKRMIHEQYHHQKEILKYSDFESLERVNIVSYFSLFQIVVQMGKSLGIGFNDIYGLNHITLEFMNNALKKLGLFVPLTEFYQTSSDICNILYLNNLSQPSQIMREYTNNISSSNLTSHLLSSQRKYQNLGHTEENRNLQNQIFIGRLANDRFPFNSIQDDIERPATWISNPPSTCIKELPTLLTKSNLNSSILARDIDDFCWIFPNDQKVVEVVLYLGQPSVISELCLTVAHGTNTDSYPFSMDVYLGTYTDDLHMVLQNASIPRCVTGTKLSYQLPTHPWDQFYNGSALGYSTNTGLYSLLCMERFYNRVVKIVFNGTATPLTVGKIEVFGHHSNSVSKKSKLFNNTINCENNNINNNSSIELPQHQQQQSLGQSDGKVNNNGNNSNESSPNNSFQNYIDSNIIDIIDEKIEDYCASTRKITDDRYTNSNSLLVDSIVENQISNILHLIEMESNGNLNHQCNNNNQNNHNNNQNTLTLNCHTESNHGGSNNSNNNQNISNLNNPSSSQFINYNNNNNSRRENSLSDKQSLPSDSQQDLQEFVNNQQQQKQLEEEEGDAIQDKTFMEETNLDQSFDQQSNHASGNSTRKDIQTPLVQFENYLRKLFSNGSASSNQFNKITLTDVLELEMKRISLNISMLDRDLLLGELQIPFNHINPMRFIFERDEKVETTIRKNVKIKTSNQCQLAQCGKHIYLDKFRHKQCPYCYKRFCPSCMSGTPIKIIEYSMAKPIVVCSACAVLIAKQESMIRKIIENYRKYQLDRSHIRLTFHQRVLLHLCQQHSTPGSINGLHTSPHQQSYDSLARSLIPLSEYPSSGILCKVPTDTRSPPIETILIPPGVLPLSTFWSAPPNVNTVDIDIVLSFDSLVYSITLLVDSLGYYNYNLPTVDIKIGKTFTDNLENAGQWVLQSNGWCSNPNQIIQPQSCISYYLPQPVQARVISLKFTLPNIPTFLNYDNEFAISKPFLHIGRIAVHGVYSDSLAEIPSFLSSSIPLDTTDKELYENVLYSNSSVTLKRNPIKIISSQMKSPRCMHISIDPMISVKGFSVIISHSEGEGVKSQIKGITVSGVTVNQKNEYQSHQFINQIVVPKSRQNSTLYFDLPLLSSSIGLLIFEFISNYGGNTTSLPKINLY